LQDRDHAAAGGDDGVGFALHEACGVAAHEFHIVGRPALVEFDFAAFRPPKSLELLFERAHPRLYVRLSFRVGHQESDAPHPLAHYLRARRERPRSRAAEQRYERAPPHHSITSSARASSCGGTSRPSALAVFRLITSSYLVGACTGRSAGFSPLRMRST